MGGVIICQLSDGTLDIQTPDLFDYKFFCFNGIPKYCQVISGRGIRLCSDFFDENWIRQPFHEPADVPFAECRLDRPRQLDRMWKIAGKLAEGTPFLRIDLYYVNDKIYVGELTFYPTSGFGGFSPSTWDLHFGKMIELPTQ